MAKGVANGEMTSAYQERRNISKLSGLGTAKIL